MIFAASKLLSFLPFGNFLSGTLGKILLVIAIAAAIFIGFRFWLSAHDDAVREAALREWNQQQIEQLEEDRAEFQRRLNEVQREQSARVARLQSERDRLARQTSELIGRIRSGQFDGSEVPSSPVLQEAVRALRERMQEDMPDE